MGIIIKFILKNIKEKKLRTILITTAVAAACALFFASSGISDSYKNSYITMIRSSIGNADIIIHAEQKSPSRFLSMNKVESVKQEAEYIVGVMNGTGSYKASRDESVEVSIRGIDFEDLMKVNPIMITEEVSLTPFSGNEIIISNTMSDKYNLKAGQKIKIKINEANEEFTIAAVAQKSSYFKTEQTEMVAIMPRETISRFNSAQGKVASILVKAKDSTKTKELIETLKEQYKDYTVRETIDQKEIDSSLQTVKVSFNMMLTVVLIMSMFIIYTAFKVIIMERMPVIGTFRSIGATKRTTNLVLIAESVIYGILGGFLGEGLGIGILYIVGVMMNPYRSYIKPKFEYNHQLLIWTFIFGIAVSFASAILPIMKVSKIPVKDIVLNKVDSAKNKKNWKFLLGILLVAYSIAIPLNTPKNSSLAMLLNLTAMISIIIAAIILIPYFNFVFVKLLGAVYSVIFGNEGVLAAKNLRNNKSLLNNISLLSIGISALFMINVVSFSMGKEVTKAYGAWACDIVVYPRVDMTSENSEDIKKIVRASGVEDAVGISTVRGIEVDSSRVSNNRILAIDSLSSKKFSDYINVEFIESVKSIPEDFDNERNIMITSQLKSRLEVNIGDKLVLKTVSGKKEYKVVGVFSTLMMNGSYAFIPEKYMKNDFKVKNYDKVFVKTSGDNVGVSESLKDIFRGKRYIIDTLKHMEEENARDNENMMKQLTAFPLISIIIGAFGVINNFIISFIERKRSFAVLASIGMSRRQSIKVLFVEALSVGLIGGIMGVATGCALTSIIPLILKAMELPLAMHYSVTLFVMCFVLGIGIALIASIAPTLKSSKLNIIDAIKYE